MGTLDQTSSPSANTCFKAFKQFQKDTMHLDKSFYISHLSLKNCGIGGPLREWYKQKLASWQKGNFFPENGTMLVILTAT